jgi:hypothetical protein
VSKKKTSISLRVPTLAKIKSAADADKRSVSSWIEIELERYFLGKSRRRKAANGKVATA